MTNERLSQAVAAAREARRRHDIDILGWSPLTGRPDLVALQAELNAYDDAEARDEWPAMADLARWVLTEGWAEPDA